MTLAESILIGASPAMRLLRRTIDRVAAARIPVLIEGPTGTGKELVATLLHQLSGRRGALVAFNVCAIGDTMFEDALFGHVRGAYTGAATDTLGYLREANGGTVFFDEIGGLSQTLQAKLLRAIETGAFRPIGGARDATSDFRLVSATNEGLDSLVAAGRFRADLAHRLSGIVLTMPSLAERARDIPLLVSHFSAGVAVDPAALTILQTRAWPGNVRELKQVVDSALVFARDRLDDEAIRQALEHRSRSRIVRAEDGHPNPVERSRSKLIALLERVAWNAEHAAVELGIHRSTLYRRIKRLGIHLPPAMCVRDAAPATAREVIPVARLRAVSRDIGDDHRRGIM